MRFLCLYDFSEHASVALQTASFLASKVKGSELIVFHVCDEHQFEAHRKALKNITEGLVPDTRASYFLDSGDFFERLEAYVRLNPPDLLIFCTRGVHGWRQHVFGPNSIRLCELCPSPVIILNSGPFEADEGAIVWNANYAPPVPETVHFLNEIFSQTGRFRWLVHVVDDEQEAIENARLVETLLTSEGAAASLHVEAKSLPSLGLGGDIIRFSSERDARLIVCGFKNASLPTWRSDAERLINNEAGIAVLIY
jgi:nucleotide-binding universal stress UspA family protein